MTGVPLNNPTRDAGREQHAADGELVRRAQAGDAQAVADIYRKHVQAIYRYIAARVDDAQAAEDLTSEVFLKAIESLDRYKHRGAPLAAWLYRIARDRVSDYYRLRARRPVSQLDDTLTDECPGPEAQVLHKRDLDQLFAQVGRLTDDQRDVIYFRFAEELSLERTADLLGKTIGATKALQFRALQALARHFE